MNHDLSMRPVTSDEFFAALYADKRDIMPRIVSQYDPVSGFTSEWSTNNSAQVLFGKSDDADGGRYWLVTQ